MKGIYLFSEAIRDEKAWGDIHKRKDVFEPLILEIYKRERLPFAEISNIGQSTNAVFKVGNSIIKIYSPHDPSFTKRCYKSEIFGLKRALSLGLPAAKLLASGIIHDKYSFRYIISEFIDGVNLSEIFGAMDSDNKYLLGRKLRGITDNLNTPCKPFNDIDYPDGAISDGYNGWLSDLGFRENFINDRNKHIKSLEITKKDLVFCHGDIGLVNMIHGLHDEIYIIDYANSCLAPVCVDHAYMAYWTVFDKSFLRGYFGEITTDELIDICVNGFLLSVLGMDFLAAADSDFGFTDGKTLGSVGDFKRRLRDYVTTLWQAHNPPLHYGYNLRE
jgi:thiamine kinase-like enzyme